ncbi:hypothetical protein SB2_28020 [Methylobacterium radiotolerans]|nr:hypothetical protein SB3_29535 [Methylobacterium radiotolerans]KTS43405.1 hypothetical protein SB2_28020 [Methylobacterium radiotolerans]
MSEALTVFLRAGARATFVWGEIDCSLFMADWCRVRRGVDPAASLRGRYSSPAGAMRHVLRLGGFEAMARSLMAGCGFAATCAPQPGDVGLVEHPTVGPVFAIRCALGWAVKSPEGVAVDEFPTVVAWSV